MVQSFRSRLKAHLRSVRKNEKGAVLIEMVMLTPIFITTFMGMFDITLALRARMKVNNLGYNMATMGAINGRDVTEQQLNDVLDNINKIVAPMDDFLANGKAVFAAVEGVGAANPTKAKIIWNRCAGSSQVSSPYAGAEGTQVTLPGGLTMDAGLTAMIANVSYRYTPQFVGAVFPSDSQTVTDSDGNSTIIKVKKGITLTKTYVHRSRFGEFNTIPRNDDPANTIVRDCS
jgi:Flp pilus assembly protein TadG